MDWNQLESAIADAAHSPVPLTGMQSLVDAAKSLTGATAAVLYLLQLDKAKFIARVGEPGTVLAAPQAIDVEVLESTGASTFIDAALQRRQIISRPAEAGGQHCAQLAIPLRRATSCLGILIIQRPDGYPFSAEEKSALSILAHTIVLLIEKESSLHLFEAFQHPIDFHQSLNDYLQDLLLLIAIASGMPIISIREIHHDSRNLRCIANYGLTPDLTVLDLLPYDRFGPYREAIETRKPVALTDVLKERDKLADFLDRPEVAKIRSLVIAPILVGDAVFGTLSFAAPTIFTYSHLEIAGFVTIANAIGTSITNFRNVQKLSELFLIEGELAVGITGLEVAQAARHEARNVVDSINTDLANLKVLLGRPGDNVVRIDDTLERLFANSQDILHALDKIRDVSRPPKREIASASIKAIINEAAALVAGRIAKERVALRIDGPDVELHAYVERLRHAFLNLFLNSLDAFSLRRKASNRTITIQIECRPAPGGDIYVRYIDNATGVDPTKLIFPPGTQDGPPTAVMIFQPGVTSKHQGSGYGLFLVRRILTEHKGSIDLIDYRNGVVFDLRLPRRFLPPG
jgi:signal transduction histidine kinase